MPKYLKANLHGELSYAPITLFGEKLKIGVIGAGRGALIKVINFYNKGSNIEVLALDFLEDFYKFDISTVVLQIPSFSFDRHSLPVKTKKEGV